MIVKSVHQEFKSSIFSGRSGANIRMKSGNFFKNNKRKQVPIAKAGTRRHFWKQVEEVFKWNLLTRFQNLILRKFVTSVSVKKISKFDDITSQFSHSHFHPLAWGALQRKTVSSEQTEEPVTMQVPAPWGHFMLLI